MHSRRRSPRRQRLSVSTSYVQDAVYSLLSVSRIPTTIWATNLQFTTFSSALPRFITGGEFEQGVQGKVHKCQGSHDKHS